MVRDCTISRLKNSVQKWKNDCNKKFNNKFDYSNVGLVSTDEPIEIICPIHGKFTTTRVLHLGSKTGCKQCKVPTASVQKRYEKFISDSAEKFPNVEIMECDYVNNKSRVKSKCNVCDKISDWTVQGMSSSKLGCKEDCAKLLNNKRFYDIQEEETEKWKQRCSEKFNNKFDYSKVEACGVDDRIIIICPEHGEVETTKFNHETYQTGCRFCSGVAMQSSEKLKKFQEMKEAYPNYDYSKFNFELSLEQKQIVICPEHGEFEISLHNFMNAETPCKACRYRKIGDSYPLGDKDEFIRRSIEIHGDKYDYSKTEYKRSYEPIDIECSIHGTFSQLAYNHVRGAGCPKCSKSLTENALAQWISDLGVEIKQSDRTIIKPQEIDILIESHKLCIEYNGLFYHSITNYDPNFPKKYHLIKTENAEEKGYQLFHIFENEWMFKEKRLIWESMIKNRLNLCDKIYARNCEIKEIDSKTFKEFCEANHLQGFAASKIRLGLFHKDELISAMSFSKPRFDSGHEYELIRFCNLLDTTVIGGASKLLKYFERNYKPKSIISYANRRWSQGNLYEKLGFEFSKKTEPGYFYCDYSSLILYNRLTFQKHLLEDEEYRLKYLINNYDSSISADANMLNNKYGIIHDSGNIVFTKTYSYPAYENVILEDDLLF